MATVEVEVKDEETTTETETEVKEEVEQKEAEEPAEPKEETKEEPKPAPEEDTQKQLDTAVESLKDAEKAVTEKGFDYEALSKEYNEKGSLSADTYKQLEEKGFSKNMVDTFIRGIEASNKLFEKTVYDFAGGKGEYNKLQKYVEAQGKEAIAGFNEMIERGNLEGIKLLINGIKAEMTLKNGTNNASVLGSNNSGRTTGFASEADWIKAVDDPRYGVDDAYTNKVAERLMKSSFVEYR